MAVPLIWLMVAGAGAVLGMVGFIAARLENAPKPALATHGTERSQMCATLSSPSRAPVQCPSTTDTDLTSPSPIARTPTPGSSPPSTQPLPSSTLTSSVSIAHVHTNSSLDAPSTFSNHPLPQRVDSTSRTVALIVADLETRIAKPIAGRQPLRAPSKDSFRPVQEEPKPKKNPSPRSLVPSRRCWRRPRTSIPFNLRK